MKFIPLAAAALATSFALASDPARRPVDYLVVGFEDATKDTTVIDGELWTGDSDSAIVREYAGTPSLQSYPAPFENAGSQFLEIDASSEVKVNPGAQGGITYIDSMVKFSAAEEDPSASITDAMFLLWLQKNGSSYDIKVKGALAGLDENDSFSLPAKTYTITGSGVSIEPDSWHRVKVAFFPQLFGEEGDAFAAFTIQIDDVDMAATEATCTQSVYDDYISGSIDDEYAALFAANKMIPASNPAAAITSIGFQGNGAIDDLVVSADSALQIEQTLSWPAGLTGVSYKVDDGEAVALAALDGSAKITVTAGSTITLIGTIGYADVTVEGTAAADTSITLPAIGAAYYFANGDGTSADPFQIATIADLKALQAAVAAKDADCIDAYYVQTADIALDAAWPGIGVQNGKDIVTTAAYDAGAFQGTYNGGNHTISNFQMVDGLDYCGLFNSVKGATIKNLKVSYKDGSFAKDMADANEVCGATFVGVAKASTLQNLTSLTGTVSCTKGFGGIVGYLMAGSTVDSCTNNVNLTSTAKNKAGGIAMITQNGTGTAVIRNCQNNGTTAGNANQKGGIVGYVGVATTIENCEDTAGSDPSFLHHQTGTLTLSGVNKAPAGVKSYTKNATNIDGLLFAMVDGNVATFVHNADLALGNTYKAMGPGAAYKFTQVGSITFDQSLVSPSVTCAAGLKVTSSGTGVVTYTAEALATVTVTVTGGANATAVWTVNGEQVASAPATLTEGDTYSVVYTADEGYEFAEGAVTSASGTTGTENISITIADAVAVSASGLDPAASVIEVTLDAASEEDAEAQAKAAIAVPADAAAAVTAAAYADYFEYAVVDNNDGSFTVTISGIKEEITTGVSESAVERLTDDEATAITVPAGLYYKITPSTALPISGTPVSGLSEGSVEVEKPGTSSGFYKVELSATPFDAE